MARTYVTLPVSFVVAATEKAVLLRFEDGAEHWIPRSQIHEDERDELERDAEPGEVTMTSWIAERNGLD